MTFNAVHSSIPRLDTLVSVAGKIAWSPCYI